MDLIEMHIATRSDATPIAAHPYSLALKHDFLKQEIQNLLNAGIICINMSPWASPIVVVKKHIPEGSLQQFWLCVDCRKLNSLWLAITPATSNNKGTLAIMPLPKIEELLAFLRGVKFFTALYLQSGYYHIKLDKESIPKSTFTTVFGKFEFLRLPFRLSQGPDFFIRLIYDLLELDNSSNNSPG